MSTQYERLGDAVGAGLDALLVASVIMLGLAVLVGGTANNWVLYLIPAGAALLWGAIKALSS